MTYEPISSLTEREITALECAAQDMTVNETAMRMSISAHTVHDHRKALLRKLDCHSMAGAVGKWAAWKAKA